MGTQRCGVQVRSRSLRKTLVAGILGLAVFAASAPALAETPPGAEPAAPDVVATAQDLVLDLNHVGLASIPVPSLPVPVGEPGGTADPIAVPVPAPTDVLRIGNVQVGRPDFIPPEVVGQFNDTLGGAETALARMLDGQGFEPARSDQIAANVFGKAAQGAAVGAIVASPIAVAAAIIGVAVGLVVALPFAPAGLVFMPIIAATLAVGMVVAPFAAVGAGVGAVVGGIEAAQAPAP
ncbi:hypothetical protein [Nocardia sp. NPDC058497]|uniref:hypothetical protein n=1 Tax=Nocardia sp. NPDC058497 TaxID=3346529 RepID=UPI00365A0852